MRYSREEQETIYNYDVIEKRWYISSSYKPDINKIIKRAEVVKTEKDDNGRIIYVEAIANAGQIRIYHDK